METDSARNGAVCGALMGARIGYSKLPKDWLESLVHKWWLDEKMKKFLEIVGVPFQMDKAEQWNK